MPFRSCCVLSSILTAIAASGSTVAQERTAERDLVEAFSAYCVATTADPARVKVAVEKVGKWVLVGLSAEKIRDHWGEVEEAKISTAPVQGHPHHKMLVEVGSGLGDSGRRRTCRVNMPGGDKVRLLAETAANLATGDGASDVVKEGGFKIDVTRWTIRIGDTDALIELGSMPTFAGAPRLALRLTVEGQ